MPPRRLTSLKKVRTRVHPRLWVQHLSILRHRHDVASSLILPTRPLIDDRARSKTQSFRCFQIIRVPGGLPRQDICASASA
jgi:hypothetical protein